MKLINKIKFALKLNLFQYIYYNYFCKNVIRHNGHKLYPYKHSIIEINPESQLILDGNFIFNISHNKHSKLQGYIILGRFSQLHIQENIKVLDGCSINVRKHGKAVFNTFTCNINTSITCSKEIIIGTDCIIGKNVLINDTAFHPTGTSIKNMKVTQIPVHIGNHVWLGERSVIMPGTTIGDGAIIGYNACVSGNIDPGVLVTATYDQPKLSGILWALDMNSIETAEKYKITSEINNHSSGLQVDEYTKRIISILSSIYTSIDFDSEISLVDDRIIDSLGLITVTNLLEKEFSIKIPFESVNADNFNSIHSMAALVSELQQKNKKEETKNEDTELANIILEPLYLDIKETEKPVVQRILENAIENPNDIAIIANEKETTYQELANMIYSISKWLKNIGIDIGDCVVVEAICDIISIATFYAIHLIGAISVPIENNAPRKRIEEIAIRINCKCVICKLSVDNDNWYSFNEIISVSHEQNFNPNIKIEYPNIDTACEIVFTTGTTGKSKGVLKTHRGISWDAYAFSQAVKMKKNNRLLCTFPLHCTGGLSTMHIILSNGCCLACMDGLNNIKYFFDFKMKYQITSLHIPPQALRIILFQTDKELAKFKNQIDFIAIGSSPLPCGDAEKLKALLPKSRLYIIYGSSETLFATSYFFNEKTSILKNCIGKANTGVDISILLNDGTMTNMPHNQGRICIKSCMNLKEYYLEPELTNEFLKDGWFYTNDLGYFDEEGNLFCLGRIGDVINLGGYKIAPSEIEEVALLSGLINECICIEDYDQSNLPLLKLLVVVKDESKFDSNQLRSFLADRLESYKIPRMIEITDKIEKTFNGKINRKAYRKPIM